MNICEYSAEKCKNKNCKETVPKIYMKKHLEECEFGKVLCQKCNFLIKKSHVSKNNYINFFINVKYSRKYIINFLKNNKCRIKI